MIVWRSYQYECSRNHSDASPEHREIVVKTVNDYLNGKDPAKIKFLPHVKPDRNFIHQKIIRPASLAVGAVVVLVSVLRYPFIQKHRKDSIRPAKRNTAPS